MGPSSPGNAASHRGVLDKGISYMKSWKILLAAGAASFAFSAAAMAQDATPPASAAPGATPAAPAAAPPAPTGPQFAFNLAVTSDYVFRGISQTSGEAAASGGIDVTDGLFYVG